MILCDIEFDLPYIKDEQHISFLQKEQGLTIQEATRTDYKENWCKKRISFIESTSCISYMVCRNMGRINTQSYRKILISCLPCSRELRSFWVALSVGHVELHIDIDRFFQLDEMHIKSTTVKLIREAVDNIMLVTSDDLHGVTSACSAVEDNAYYSNFFWGKAQKLQDGVVARVWVEHDVHELRIFVLFEKREKIIKKVLLLKSSPRSYWCWLYLGSFSKTDNNTVVLTSKQGKQFVALL